MNKNFYRPDVDGLRAVAVLAVLIFHINPKWLPGGFLGVDIFFVISGFLITSIIRRSIEANTFSYKEFYLKRIKRILPPFYIVTATTLVVAYFLFSPIDYRSVANSSLASTLFLGNFRFALMGDYFQSDATKPLLHYWSLAVEEQFYFIWPTCLMLLYSASKRKPNIILASSLFLAAISFLLAQYYSGQSLYAPFSYFMLPTRMGELLIGCSLAYLRPKVDHKVSRSAISLLGVLLLIGSLLFIDKHSVFPGINAIYPCIGIALIIYSGPSTYVNQCLASKPAVFIGLLSYSLYLWHWPTLTFIRYLVPGIEFSLVHGVLISIALIFVSYLSLICIENKARASKLSNKQTLIYFFIAPSILLLAVSVYISKTGGLPQRFELTEEMTNIETIGCHGSLTTNSCFLSSNQKEPYDILLVGDSHAGHFSHFIQQLSNKNNFSAIDASSPGCPFYESKVKSLKCESAKQKIQSLLPKVGTVIIAKRFDDIYMQPEFLTNFSEYINKLKLHGVNIVVLAQIPKHSNEHFLNHYLRSRLSQQTLAKDNHPDDHYQKANKLVKQTLTEQTDIFFLSFDSFLCKQDKCLQLDEHSLPLYFDDDHLTAYGAEWIFGKFEKSTRYHQLIDYIRHTKGNRIN